MTRPGATRDPRGPEATFTSGSYPRPVMEWEPEPTTAERLADALRVGLAAACIGAAVWAFVSLALGAL